MAAALAHRGPDDVGFHVAGPVGLAQTRLSIIDLERGHQPMVADGLALTANGEIYNFVELRPRLEARGRRFATRSDSETILHAYALDGLDALASLHGMFAFALHDGLPPGAGAGARSPGHQAALLRAAPRPAALRLRGEGPAGRRGPGSRSWSPPRWPSRCRISSTAARPV